MLLITYRVSLCFLKSIIFTYCYYKASIVGTHRQDAEQIQFNKKRVANRKLIFYPMPFHSLQSNHRTISFIEGAYSRE